MKIGIDIKRWHRHITSLLKKFQYNKYSALSTATLLLMLEE